MQINTPSRDLDGGGVVQGKTILIEFDGSATALTASDLMICAEKLDDASLYFTKLSNLQDCRYLLLDNANLQDGDYKMILTEYRGKERSTVSAFTDMLSIKNGTHSFRKFPSAAALRTSSAAQ